MTKDYRYPLEELQATLEEYRAASPNGLTALMCRSVYARAIKPLGYLEFGPFWWAVKRVLSANGFEVGPTDNPALAEQWTVQGDADLTLIAAWRAADQNREEYFAGSRDFAVGDSVVSIFDPDMEGGSK